MFLIVRLAIYVENLLQVRYEPRPVLLGDAEPLRLPRFKPVFLRHWRTVSGHTEVTIRNRPNSSASNRIVQRVRPSGGLLQHNATRRASARPSNLGVVPGR